jgi:hypothetical protein
MLVPIHIAAGGLRPCCVARYPSISLLTPLGRSRQLHDAQAGHNERSRKDARDRQRLTKDHDTDYEGADGTDAGPYRIGRA